MSILLLGVFIVGVAIIAAQAAAGLYLVLLPGSDQTGAAVVGLVALQVTTIILCLLVTLREGPVVGLALTEPRVTAPDGAKVLGLTVGFIVVTTALAFTLFEEAYQRDIRTFAPFFANDLWWLAALSIMIGAPVSEELLFRGLLLRRLEGAGVGFWAAAVVTCLMWTALHYGYSLIGLFEVFLAGLIMSWALRVSGSVRLPILIHCLYNSIAVGIMGFVLNQ
ncbi:MAG: type II CAAX prenyl endopeptidase Rce1 family protein [Hyphomicrobiaceae bacterium]